ncbi:MAG: O-antigen ligase family protein, partial [Anaerolineae bacterium]|nr:O-antigen ligase family protein [Anaerolineae bacterium]
LPRTYAFVAHAAIFWAVAAQRRTPWLRYSGWALLAGSLVLGIALLLGTNFGSAKLPFIDREIYSLLPGGWRPFWNPLGFNSNLTGGLLVLFLPPATALMWGGSSWQQRDVAKPVTIVLALIILLSQSRGALMGGGVALLGMSLLHDRRWGILWGLVGLGVAAAVYRYGFNPLLESLLGRSDLFGDKSLTGRQQLWQQAVFIINQFPLTGVGFGMFEPTVRQLQSAPEMLVQASREFKHAHNLYLQAGVELGLLGLIAHLVIYLRLTYLLWQRAIDRTAGYDRILALGLLGSMFALLTHGFFEVITYGPRPAAVVWALFGLMVAVAAGPMSSNEPSQRPLPPS